MQRIYRYFVFLLATVMLLTVVPESSDISAKAGLISSERNASVKKAPVLKEKVKVLFLGECTGKAKDGTKADYSSILNVRELIDRFDADKYDITLKSKNKSIVTVSSKKDRIYAKGIGQTKVTVKIKKKADKTVVLKKNIRISVKKNADAETFIVNGLESGQIVYSGDEIKVDMPGDYTDIRTIICEDNGVSISQLSDEKSFILIFEKPGVYNITAAAYLSAEFDGFTAYQKFEITVKDRKGSVYQKTADTIVFEGGPVDEDLNAEDIAVYEEQDGVPVFWSYASRADVIDDCAVITLFKSLGSNKKYILEYDGLSFTFMSGACGIADVASFDIVETTVPAGESKELTFRYYNLKGMDITSAVKNLLYENIKLSLKDKEDEFVAYFDGHKLCIVESGKKIAVTAKLLIPEIPGVSKEKELSTAAVITSVPKKGGSFTGNAVYTIKRTNPDFFIWGQKCINSLPLGDDAVFEALFEMDDGSVRKLKDAGITKILIGDMHVAMLGKETEAGGYELILNNIGTTSILCFVGDEVIGNFEISVLPKRIPSELKVGLTKNRLNTNSLVEDYIIVKADVLDQYGECMDTDGFTVTQDEVNKKQIGNIVFNEISPGRYVVNGYECRADKEQKAVAAKVTWKDFSEEIRFFIKDVEYDPSYEEFSYKLEADGKLFIDTALGLRTEAPESTFVTVKLSKDGYYVSEGTGNFFTELPSVKNGAAYYGMEPGSCFYGITIEHTGKNGEKIFVGNDEECIIPNYSDMEFLPYTYGKKLETGSYEIRVYRIKVQEKLSDIKICDSMTIKVIDSDPEIEVIQTAQSYSGKIKDWTEAIPDYFTFLFCGEDISKYITKVDCVEGSTGSVFVRSVDFMIPDPYFGLFTKTALVERLITKQ